MKEDILDKVLGVLNANQENADLIPERLHEELSSLCLDSITFIRVIVASEEKFDIEIPDEHLLLTKMDTISKMADVISTVLNNQNNAIGQ